MSPRQLSVSLRARWNRLGVPGGQDSATLPLCLGHIWLPTHTHTNTHTQTHTHTQTRTCVHAHTHTHTHKRTHTCAHTHTNAHTRTHVMDMYQRVTILSSLGCLICLLTLEGMKVQAYITQKRERPVTVPPTVFLST